MNWSGANIYTIIAFLVISLFGSLTHYHTEVLVCDYHADTPHYQENNIFCPIHVLNSESPDSLTQDYSEHFLPETSIIEISEQIHYVDYAYSFLGRAPPFLS